MPRCIVMLESKFCKIMLCSLVLPQEAHAGWYRMRTPAVKPVASVSPLLLSLDEHWCLLSMFYELWLRERCDSRHNGMSDSVLPAALLGT